MIALFTLLVILNFIMFLNFKKISNKVGIYDEPNSIKLHKKKISLAGGILVFFFYTFLPYIIKRF